jgi:D-alanyl-D-alanine carboxypeptidase (penicillin-binding protein 5/6)
MPWILLFPLLPLFAQAATVAAPAVEARNWLLIDMQSGLTLTEKDADQRAEPASLTKLMTSFLVHQAIKEGRLKLGQEINVSENAWRAEGSRMFLPLNQPAKVSDLLLGMIVQSGNDATIALAEAVAGSEAAFAIQMNAAARKLGMKNSHFVNATGLPAPEHYTTARDLALLTQALIRTFPDDYKHYAVKEFTHNRIRQSNRNRLLWLDPHADGVKTGHTDSAGYCLIASMQRDGRRLLSVVMGAQSDAARARESLKLLNWGYQSFENVKLYAAQQPVKTLRVWRGSDNEVHAGFFGDLFVTVPRGQGGKVSARISYKAPLLAPVAMGQRIGSLHVSADGSSLVDYPLVALGAVPTAGVMKRGLDSMLLMFE